MPMITYLNCEGIIADQSHALGGDQGPPTGFYALNLQHVQGDVLIDTQGFGQAVCGE